MMNNLMVPLQLNLNVGLKVVVSIRKLYTIAIAADLLMFPWRLKLMKPCFANNAVYCQLLESLFSSVFFVHVLQLKV
jgi:hypothetical protein